MQQGANDNGAVMRWAIPRLWELLIDAQAAGEDRQLDWLEQQAWVDSESVNQSP